MANRLNLPSPGQQRDQVIRRPRIAFLEYADVFEDFYPHYGVDQRMFGTTWTGSSNHAILSVVQREIGPVAWYALSVRPVMREARHEVVGCQVKFLRSALLHRLLWRAFYVSRNGWRLRAGFPSYLTLLSYAATAAPSLIRALYRDRPDLLFVQDYANGRFDVLVLLARLLSVPLIAYHAGSQPDWYQAKVVKRWTIPRADRLIVSSKNELEMLAENYGVARARMRVILTPIDTEAYRPMDRTQACLAAGLDPNRRYLLFLGRLDDGVKRVSALIRVFATLTREHQEVDLIIVGDGPDGVRLRQLATECAPGRVDFLGWVGEPAAKAGLYNVADCLILVSRSEGFPAVVGEAMACGTPVLATRVGGVEELVVDGETGWLVPAGDDEALRVRLAAVLAGPDAARSMRVRARSLAEARVSPASVASELKECFAGVGTGRG